MCARVLLITGPPGVGKTTALRSVFERLSANGVVVEGFFTQEDRPQGGGSRVGFTLSTWDGAHQAQLAHANLTSPVQVGRYGVDVRNMDDFSKYLVPPTSKEKRVGSVFLVDEVGKMECAASSLFCKRMEALLSTAGCVVVATVAQHGGGLVAKVKKWPGVEIIEVGIANRAVLPQHLADWVTTQLLDSGSAVV
eukprot:CAMPEP_0177659292 /NCGR_PEP_ID=MMETSP0447-20121125/17362_1 /TAXON_ID=0 /ORGANISM="Stygamoeba regulata, Strain BSH-02190019" /LENGTH=193 /DNA_ID=CAMNT_0019164147 /DNA_START=119 /DNA_END=701 /DNA_ORIENTATION=+